MIAFFWETKGLKGRGFSAGNCQPPTVGGFEADESDQTALALRWALKAAGWLIPLGGCFRK